MRSSAGELVRLGAPKPRALLAVLLLHANQPVSSDRLAAVLWPRRPPRAPNAALRTYVSDLRRLLQLRQVGLPRLATEPGGYQLWLSSTDVDVSVFEDLVGVGRRAFGAGDPVAAAEPLRRGLALWRGRVLEDVPLEGAELVPRLAHLEEQRLDAWELWAEAELASGRHHVVAAGLARTTAEQPLRERLWALRMLALHRAGRPAEALATYRELRRLLAAELGIEPGEPVRCLRQQILGGDPALQPSTPGTGWLTPTPAPCQLPSDIAGFSGRRRELVRLCALIRPDGEPGRATIAAIDGPGGVGKSALVIHAAHRLADRFPDGQLYACLRGTTAPVPALTVLGRFLRALGVSAGEVPQTEEEAAERFRAVSAGRRLLVVLDDAADAAHIRALIPTGPSCAVLVTSRRVLATLDGVHHLHLDQLSAAEAVVLLGRLVGTRRVDADIDQARRIVRYCDHMPLAVRIAGARLAARPSWSLAALATRLADAQGRLDELRIDDLGVRTSFRVGYQQLAASSDPADRAAAAVFPLLGLPDGADLDRAAAARLLDRDEQEAERSLERLVDAQLLQTPVSGRYQLHDLMRLFARELATADHSAAELRAARLRLFDWYLATVWRCHRMLRPGDRRPEPLGVRTTGQDFADAASALAWLEVERANLVAAVGQAAGIDPGRCAGLARGLNGFFSVRGYWSDWTYVNESALAAASCTLDVAYARLDLGIVADLRGDYPTAIAELDRAARLFGLAADRHGQASCHTALGIVRVRLEQPDLAQRHLEEGLSIRRAMGDRHGEAVNLGNLGELHRRQGRYDEALARHRTALPIFHELGERWGTAHTLQNLGQVRLGLGQLAEAADLLGRSLAGFEQLGDDNGRAGVLCDIGALQRVRGATADALASLEQAAAIYQRLGNRHAHADCCHQLGSTLLAMGRTADAARQWRRALVEMEELELPAAEVVCASLHELSGAVPADC